MNDDHRICWGAVSDDKRKCCGRVDLDPPELMLWPIILGINGIFGGTYPMAKALSVPREALWVSWATLSIPGGHTHNIPFGHGASFGAGSVPPQGILKLKQIPNPLSIITMRKRQGLTTIEII